MTLIAISAGHYPLRPGARARGTDEWHEAMEWASRIVRLMGDISFFVPTGVLKEKVDFINAMPDVEVACEIHFNSYPGGQASGSETLYYPGSEKGRQLAEGIQRRLGAIFTPDRGAKEGWYRMDKSNGPDFFLAKTSMTSIIIEPEFLVNIDDIRSKMETGCQVIAEQLIAFIQNEL